MSIKLFIINKEACELRCLETRFFAKLPSKNARENRVTSRDRAWHAGRGENRDFFRDDAKNREKNADFSQKGILFQKNESLAGSALLQKIAAKIAKKLQKPKNRDFLRLLKPCFLKLFLKKQKIIKKMMKKTKKRENPLKKGQKIAQFSGLLAT